VELLWLLWVVVASVRLTILVAPARAGQLAPTRSM